MSSSRGRVRHRVAVALPVAALLAAGCASSSSPHGAGPSTVVPPATSTTTVSIPAITTTTTSTTAPPRPSTSTVAPTTTTIGAARPAVALSRGVTDQKVVALTFDAGSDTGNTIQILTELSARHVPATFGLTGLWAQANPDLVRRISAAGDQIVNHSWDHRSFTGASTGTSGLSPTEIDQELARTENLIRQLTGRGTAGWFRPPYGDRSSAVDSAAGAAGYQWELMWTVDTLGWKGVAPATVVQRALAALAPGEIILMHVGSASTDSAALPALIDGIRARGYGFVVAARLV